MFWLVVMWVVLIALWGSSDGWSLDGVLRRVAAVVHDVQRDRGAPPPP